MKRIILLIIVVFSLSVYQTSAKTFAFGVKGGMTLSSLTFKGDFSENFNSDNRGGFFVGPMLNISLPLGFNIEAAAMYAYDKVQYSNQNGGVTDKRHLIEVPVNLRWQISAGNIIGVYILAGPDFSFNLNETVEIENYIKQTLETEGINPSVLKDETKPLSMGLGVGAGIVFFDHLNIGFNYVIPMGYTYKYVLGETGLEFSSKVERWQISAAYIF